MALSRLRFKKVLKKMFWEASFALWNLVSIEAV